MQYAVIQRLKRMNACAPRGVEGFGARYRSSFLPQKAQTARICCVRWYLRFDGA
jgi:hypothetical protein